MFRLTRVCSKTSMLQPIADWGKRDEIEKSGGEFFVASCDSSLFFDSLEEIFDVMSVFIVALVIGFGSDPIGFRWNTGFQAALVQEFTELIWIIGFVSKDRGIVESIDECMYFGIWTTSWFSNQLKFRTLRATKSVFMGFYTCWINPPQFSLRCIGAGCNQLMNLIPDALLTPVFPSGVDSGVWCKNTQGSPAASFSKPKEKSLKNDFDRNSRPTSFRF